jgi:hypothetical protein
VTASANRKIRRGVLETHAKRSIHHRAAKSPVRTLKAKLAHYISLIEDCEIIESSQVAQSKEFWSVPLYRNRRTGILRVLREVNL